MLDKEKVIKAVQCCTQPVVQSGGCTECPYRGGLCQERFGADILELLREQEERIEQLEKALMKRPPVSPFCRRVEGGVRWDD